MFQTNDAIEKQSLSKTLSREPVVANGSNSPTKFSGFAQAQDAHRIIYTHTPDGVAVSMLEGYKN